MNDKRIFLKNKAGPQLPLRFLRLSTCSSKCSISSWRMCAVCVSNHHCIPYVPGYKTAPLI